MQLWPIMLEHATPEAIAEFVKENENEIFAVSAWFLDEAGLEANVGIGDCLPEIWARQAYWRPEELAALCLGKNPTLIHESSCSTAMFRQDVAQQFLEILEAIRRAIDVNDMFEYARPWYALSWLKTNRIDYPDVLEHEVAKLGGTVSDWRAKYERTQAILGDLEEALTHTEEALAESDAHHSHELRQMSEQTNRLASMLRLQEAERARLEANTIDLRYRLAEAEQALKDADSKGLRGKLGAAQNKNRTCHQAIRALLLIGYGDDFSPNDSKRMAEAVSDLSVHGVEKTDQTLRKLIVESFEKTAT